MPILNMFQRKRPTRHWAGRVSGQTHAGRTIAVLCACVLLGCLALASPALAASPSAKQNSAVTASVGHASTDSNSYRAVARQQSSSNDGEGRDDRNTFRHSVVVRSVGHFLHLGPESAARLFEFFNFALLFGGVLYLFLKFFPRYLRRHRDEIRKRLLDARSANEKANVQLKAIEERLRGMDEEIRVIREQAERDSAAEEAHIRELIEGERQRILVSAQKEIAAATAEARRRIRRFAGELAVDRARRMISLSDAQDHALTVEITRRLARQAMAGSVFPTGSEGGGEDGELL